MSSLATFISFDSAADGPSTTHWLWHGLIAAGKVTLFTSLWKSGKTTLLAHFLARLRTGGEFLGQAVAPGGSLIVSEEPRDLWPERRRRLGLGTELGVLTRPFAGRPTLANFQSLHDQIIDLRRERPLDLVVFDSLAMFLPARTENDAGVMVDALAPFLALADAGLAVWLLHHPAKGDPALGQAARGSGALMASVDIILEMRHPGGDPFTRRRKLFGWSRYTETPRQLQIELSPDGTRYDRLPDGPDEFHAHWDMLRTLFGSAAGPLTRQQIWAAWPEGVARPHEATLWRWLDRAVELGLAVRIGKGTKTESFRYGVGR
jgi:AAA domain